MTVCISPPTVGTVYTIGSWSAGDAVPVIDEFGNQWSITQEDGLQHSAAPRTNVVAREQSDGDFDGDAWQPGRSISLTGQIKSPTMPLLYDAIARMRALLVAGPRRLPLVVAQPNVTVQTIVRRDAETTVDKDKSTQPSASFTLVLYSADSNLYGADPEQGASTGVFSASAGRAYPLVYPRVYGPSGTDGVVAVTNNGNTDTFPIIVLSAGTGPMVNPQVTLVGGLTLLFTTTLNAGDTLTIDTGARTVLLNGTAARNWPLPSGTLPCPGPGVSQLLFNAFTSSPGAEMSVTWRDAYA